MINAQQITGLTKSQIQEAVMMLSQMELANHKINKNTVLAVIKTVCN